MRECLVNLARVKDAVTQVTDRNGDGAGLDAVPEQLQGIIAGLMMLGTERAAGVVDGLQRAIRSLVRQGPDTVDRSRLDRLADATVSLEYYLETLQAGRSDPNYMLDNAERCLAGLAAEETPDAGAGHQDRSRRGPRGHRRDGSAGVRSRRRSCRQPRRAAAGTRRRGSSAAGASGSIPSSWSSLSRKRARRSQPSGATSPPGSATTPIGNALASLRRSFHTLKGSGRMVGADLIGEFCWNVERLLNRIINGTVRRHPANHGRSAAEHRRRCRRCSSSWRSARTPQQDINALMAEVQALVEAPGTRPAPAGAEREPVAPVSEIARPPEPA